MKRLEWAGLMLAGFLGCARGGVAPVPVDGESGTVTGDTLSGVRAILDFGQAGDTVRVRGLCLRVGSRGALGAPPVTRSDWVLADARDSMAVIWVTGERPKDCGYDAGSRTPIDLRGVVGVDSIEVVTGKVVRRFLWKI
jgi:hypothetical protein